MNSSKQLDMILDAAADIRMNPEEVERFYMARQLVQCTLPHSDPGNVPVWTRTNGHLTLAIRPYIDLRTRKPHYPYGSIPRLLLFWLVTEATQKKSRRIRLGNSLDSFMREIGLNPRTGGGKRGDAARLHMQMERLFRAIVSFEDQREWSKSYVDMQVAPRGTLWWDPLRAQQDNLWESWVELGEEFYAAITVAPVPVDMRALRALKRSPLALDLYSWLTYTSFTTGIRSKPRIIPWTGLHAQMGAEYAELRQFRAKVLFALRKIELVCPTLKVDTTKEALIVHPSRPAVPSKPALTRPADVNSTESEKAERELLSNTSRKQAHDEAEAQTLARRVMAACGLSDAGLQPVIAAALEARTTSCAGVNLEQAATEAIELRRHFVEVGDLLKYTVGPEKFFSQGWCWDWNLWPVDRNELQRRRNANVGRRWT